MLYLDVDLYEPTLKALRAFVPLMPKGAVIVFDEAGYQRFPGESLALKEFFGPRNIPKLERHPFQSMVSFMEIE
jgi:hypothetical protein